MWDNVGYLKEGNVRLPRGTLLLLKKKFPHFFTGYSWKFRDPHYLKCQGNSRGPTLS